MRDCCYWIISREKGAVPASCVTNLGAGATNQRLEETIVSLQRTEGADIDQGEVEAELVFGAQRAECVAAVLDADAAAVPVVIALCAAALDQSFIRVHGSGDGGTQTFFVGMAIPQQPVILAEAIRSSGESADEQFAGSTQEGMPPSEKD